jgi:hypothetical protein
MVLADLKKYLTKNSLIIGLAILCAISMYTSCNQRSKLLLTRSELESVQVLNSYVDKERLRLDSLMIVLNKSIKERDVLIAKKDKKINYQYQTIALLKDSLKSTLGELASVTADSSYKYINDRVKPIADLKYPFDSIQVKKIHYTFLERDGLFFINGKLDTLVGDLRLSSYIKDNQIGQLKDLNNVYLSKNNLLNSEIQSQKIEITGLTKSNKQQTNAKRVAVTTGGVAIGYILIHALFGN